ncbi:hypothetical protein VB776_19620 [Arcicella sp. DC2W]|uniref:Uncharacterized protein n=1 Tax=Arcicella gelida TaxID=2984195 RepID=A0ABU5S9N9_9BACT|nr:hypothetical protein [Arcicella sp. DC2W]MEA5405154.1 hypothetical protein [Arcicella sp. DC2W]
MLQTFEGTIHNGHVIFNEGVQPPRNAKVLITVLQVEEEVPKTEKVSLLFRGALKDLSQAKKDQNNKEIQDLRNEWQRDI